MLETLINTGIPALFSYGHGRTRSPARVGAHRSPTSSVTTKPPPLPPYPPRTPRGGLPLRAGASLSLTGDSHAPQRALLAKPPHAITSRPPSASIGLAQRFALGSMLFFAYGIMLRAPDEITLGAVLRAPLGARSPPPLRAATPSDLQSTANSSLSLPVGGGLSGYGGRSHYATQGSPCPSCLRAPVIAPARPNGVRRL